MGNNNILLAVTNVKTNKNKRPTLMTKLRFKRAVIRARKLRQAGKQVDYCLVPDPSASDATSRMFLQLGLAQLDQHGNIAMPRFHERWATPYGFVRMTAVNSAAVEHYL